MQIIKFKPSSHSDDGTLIATFKSVDKAKDAGLGDEYAKQ
jgi:hypothetical protein